MAECTHPRLRQFPLKDGTVIKMCPDCDAFDAERRALLFGPPTGRLLAEASSGQVFWDEDLDRELKWYRYLSGRDRCGYYDREEDDASDKG